MVQTEACANGCVANAVAGAYEYLVKRHLGEEAYDVSRMFIYYNARYLEDAEHEDEGTAIGDALEGLKTYGACSEETWPFDEELVNEEPEEGAYDEAQNFLVEDMAQHWLASHIDQHLGPRPGVRPHSFAVSRNGKDQLHG